MFKTFLWCMSLRTGAAISALLHWAVFGFLIIQLAAPIDYPARIRELDIFWFMFTDTKSKDVRFGVLCSVTPFTFLGGLFIIVALFLNDTEFLSWAALMDGLFLAIMAPLCVYIFYYYHFVTTMRGTIIVTCSAWFALYSLLLSLSLRKQLKYELHIIHLNYRRDSFVLPFRRFVFDAVGETERHKQLQESRKLSKLEQA